MKRLFAALLALSCIFASSASFARREMGHGPSGGGTITNPSVLFGGPVPPVAPPANSIPAPLAQPSAPPAVNGPLSQPAFQGMSRYTNGGL